jgi:hypothetical protein
MGHDAGITTMALFEAYSVRYKFAIPLEVYRDNASR